MRLKNINKGVTAFFAYTSKEIRGVIVLAVLILSFFVYEIFFSSEKVVVVEHTIEHKDSSYQKKSYRSFTPYKKQAKPSITLSYFDPNQLSDGEWKRFGLSEKQVKVIRTFIQKGGRFSTVEDVKKMYVISDKLYAQLLPYIRIQPISTPLEAQPSFSIAINSADIEELKKIKGVKHGLLYKIVSYREALGGYISSSQLLEVYSMDSISMHKIVPYLDFSSDSIKKIAINQATYGQLVRHPYINKEVAQQLLQCKKILGKFTRKEDVLHCGIIEESTLQKIAPYLSYK